jgi:hypothetical protein
VTGGAFWEPTTEEEMLRALIYVTLLATLFGASVLWAGNAIGSWEPPNVPLHASGAVSTETTKVPKHHQKKHKAPAKRAKKH